MHVPSVNPARPAGTGPLSKPGASAKPLRQVGKSRRLFLLAMFGSWMGVGWTAFITSLTGMSLGTLRYLFPNVVSEPPSKFKAGLPDEYEPDTVVTRYKAPEHTWIIRHQFEETGDIIYALDATCTHLGCTPNWLERERKFKCPCHGSGFRISGVNFEGPAPRPLERVAIGVGEDGLIVVDKSKHFREELGQWTDPSSFIKI